MASCSTKDYEYDGGRLTSVSYYQFDTNGARTLQGRQLYEYDDEELLQRIYDPEDTGESAEVTFVYEDGRLASRTTWDLEGEYYEILFFDELGQPTFSDTEVEGEDITYWDAAVGFTFSPNYDRVYLDEPAQPVPPDVMFPLHEHTPKNLFDFDLTGQHDSYSRRLGFDADGRLERVECVWSEFAPFVVEVLRCNSVVVETMDLPDPDQPDPIAAYYYGCDDFELPSLSW